MNRDTAGKTFVLDYNAIPVHTKQIDYLNTLLDNINEFCYTYDTNGYLTYANKKTLHTLQYQASEFIGRHCLDFVPPEYHSAIRTQMQNRLTILEPGTHEHPVYTKDGNLRLLRVNSSPIIQEGIVYGAMCLSEDISQQRQAEMALRISEQKFSKAFCCNPGLVTITTLLEGRFLEINESFLSTTGYSRDEVIGNSAEGIKLWTNSEVRTTMVNNLSEKGLVRNMEIEFRNKAGEMHTGLWSAETIELGEEICIISIVVDISERKQADELLQRLREQTARTQRAASLSAMSAGIVHEIAQPLNAIKILTDSTCYWINKGRVIDSANFMEVLKEISQEANHIEDIIKHMRSMAYLGQGAVMSQCSLNQAVENAFRGLEQQIYHQGIVVETNLSSDLPKVHANPQRLEEMVRNLLVNAIQALDTVQHRRKLIRCLTRQMPGKIVLEIIDNASGIQAGIQDKIYDPFFSTKNKSDNLGLGLFIIQSVVISLNGEIQCWNNELGGTTFQIELPV